MSEKTFQLRYQVAAAGVRQVGAADLGPPMTDEEAADFAKECASNAFFDSGPVVRVANMDAFLAWVAEQQKAAEGDGP